MYPVSLKLERQRILNKQSLISAYTYAEPAWQVDRLPLLSRRYTAHNRTDKHSRHPENRYIARKPESGGSIAA
jgi:hypothetical protein